MPRRYLLLVFLNLHHLFGLFVIISSSLASEAENEFRGRAKDEKASFRRKLILVLINGFAHYWTHDEHRFNLSGFTHLRRHGSRAAYLQPEFPTLSLPNQYSLLTGNRRLIEQKWPIS